MKTLLANISAILMLICVMAIVFILTLADQSEVAPTVGVVIVSCVGALICAHFSEDKPHARKKPAK